MTKQQSEQKEIPFEAKDLVDLLGIDLTLTVFRTAYHGVEGMLSQPAYTQGFVTARYQLGYLSAIRTAGGEKFPTQPLKEAREEYIFRPDRAEFSDVLPPIMKGIVFQSSDKKQIGANGYVTLYFKEVPKQKTLQQTAII